MPPTLFVAIVPPAEAVEALSQAVDVLRSRAPELSWVANARWHVTLAFLGRVEPNDDVRDRLARVARRHPAPTLHVAGAGRFSDRVLFAKLAGDLGPLAAGVARAAARAGYDVPERRFRAHLTLARARRFGTDLRPLVAGLAHVNGPPWRCDRLRLMRGTRPLYETVADWPFGAAPDVDG